MTNVQAYVFLVLGGGLRLLPLLAPAHFPPNSVDGGNTSALWLQLMGWVIGGVGTAYLVLLDVLPFITYLLHWRPAPLPELLPESLLRPSLQLVAADYRDHESERNAAA